MANVFRRFLISQSIVFPQIFGMVIGMKKRNQLFYHVNMQIKFNYFLGAVIHLVLTYCLVNMTSLGFFGAIIVIPITTWIIFFTIVVSYIVYYMYMKRNCMIIIRRFYLTLMGFALIIIEIIIISNLIKSFFFIICFGIHDCSIYQSKYRIR